MAAAEGCELPPVGAEQRGRFRRCVPQCAACRGRSPFHHCSRHGPAARAPERRALLLSESSRDGTVRPWPIQRSRRIYGCRSPNGLRQPRQFGPAWQMLRKRRHLPNRAMSSASNCASIAEHDRTPRRPSHWQRCGASCASSEPSHSLPPGSRGRGRCVAPVQGTTTGNWTGRRRRVQPMHRSDLSNARDVSKMEGEVQRALLPRFSYGDF